MKTLLKIAICLLGIVSYGQEGVEVPLSTFGNVPNGTYIKDIDNVYLPYIGVWKGTTTDNKEFTLELVKFTKRKNIYPNGDYNYEDELMGKYQLKDLTTGTILFSTINISNYGDYRIYAVGSPNNGKFELMFTDITCFNSLMLFLGNIVGSPNQLRYTSMYDEWISYRNCPYSNQGDIPLPLPKPNEVVYLTKQ